MTLYEQLGIEPAATNDEIKRAYFRLVRQYTPEKAPEEFMLIRRAYEQLSDEDDRAVYDEGLSFYADIPGEAAEIIMEADQMLKKRLAIDAAGMLEMRLKEFKSGSAAANALLHSLASMYLELDKSGKAVEIAESLLADEPNNIKYLSLAVAACRARGWTKKSYSFLREIQRIDPGNEDAVLALISELDRHPNALGGFVDGIEAHGGKAPILCAYILIESLLLDPDIDHPEQYEQLDLFSEPSPASRPWADPTFSAKKLAEHSADATDEKRALLLMLLRLQILRKIHISERYDILPQIDRVIRNLGSEDIFQTSAYRVLSVAYAAMEAVRAGIPKMLAALPVMRVFSQEDFCDDEERRECREEALAFELDILFHYQTLRQNIKRFREEFATLYKHSADFMDAIQRYNEQKTYNEINRRINKLKRIELRYALEWLGEDDGFDTPGDEGGADPQERSEPVRVTKIGRNEPCPCGSGMKYKKCCGR